MKNSWMDEIQKHEWNKNPKVPTHIWENVVPHLPKPNKQQRFGLLFWLAGIALLGFSSIALYNTFNSGSSEKGNASIEANNSNVVLNSTDNSNQQNQDPVIHSASEIADTKSQHENDTRTSDNLSKQNHSNINQSQSNSIKTPSKPNSQSESAKELVHPTEQEQVVQTDLNKKNIEDELQKPEFGPILLNVSYITSLAGPVIANKSETKLPLVHTNGDGCFSFSSKNKKAWYIEAYAGPAYSPHTLSADQTEQERNVKQRKQTETTRIGGTAGMRLGMDWRNFSLKAGAEYLLMYDKFKYENSNDYKIVAVYRDSVLIRIDTLYGQRFVEVHNYHHLVSLPFSLGYNFRMNQSRLSAHLGASINVYTQHKGVIMHNNQLTNVNRGYANSNVYKTNVGTNLFLNLQWLSPLTERFQYFVEPGFQYYLSPFNTANYPIIQNHVSAQLKLGLRYQF